MFAAIAAGRKGYSVSLFEKNEKLGKKLFITGKGRCNLTNACDMEVLFESVVTNSRFLYSSFYGFTNQDAIAFFEELGLPTKVERGERVFPRSDHSSDVIRVLEQELKRLGVRVFLNREVREIREKDGRFQEIVLADGKKVEGDACIVATGGISYLDHRFHRRRLPFRQRAGTHGERMPAFSGAYGDRRRVDQGTPGLKPEECIGGDLRREEETL